MKKLAITGLIVGAVAFFLWRLSLSPMMCDRETDWQSDMVVIRWRTPIPYWTKYSVYDLHEKSGEITGWIYFTLWNGYGIEKVEVRGVDTGKLLYPAPHTYTQKDCGDQKLFFNFKLPEEKETALRITVYDGWGNVTETTVRISDIPDYAVEMNKKYPYKYGGKRR